jgi:ABC-type xylose transport system permease subunit
MDQLTKPAVPFWYWITATAAILWNLMGCAMFAVEVFALEAAMADWSEPQKAWARSIPAWIYFIYGVAVTTGVAGSIGLFMRKSWTVPLFAICLAAVLIQMGYTMLVLNGLEVMGPADAAMPLIVIVIAAALLGFSWFAKSRGWLGPA